ncbi:MAG: hypothetical protein QOG99_866 [Frankiales bacterium]|jgi:hypothetical protein|nr:hypothetical protein [Frankiales bacterium]
MRRLAPVLLLLAVFLAPAPPAQAATVQTEWHRYHYDVAHSGYGASIPAPGTLKKAWSVALDGQVFASPLVAEGVVVVATENNSMFGFTRGGKLLWRHHDFTPVPLSKLPCGNIDPVGITGTPVYDLGTHRVYAVVTSMITGSLRHWLIGVDVKTGHVVSRRTVDVAGQDMLYENQRGALSITRGRVLVTYGGHAGDCGPYHGYLLEVPIAGGAISTYKVGTGTEAGLWQPSGPAVGSDTSVYVVSGNGSQTSGSWDGGNAVHRVSPVIARRYSSFAPADWAQGNRGDSDLGSSGATLIGNRVWIQGKTSTGYLLDKTDLGGVGHPLATVQNACATQFGGSAVHGSVAYLPCTDGIRKITVSGNSVALGWKAASNIVGSPVVGGGVVWTIDPSGGVLYALAESSGAVRTSLTVGTMTRFMTPALSGSLALVGTTTGIVAVANA